jgi:orotate phosphoribosyltransferase
VLLDVRGSRVLLLDDTYTSGAAVQSAASALQMAGAHVVAAVVVGRYVKPDFSDDTRALWDEVMSTAFTFDSCCLET